MSKKSKMQDLKAAVEATAVVAIFIALITITGELWHPLKDTLKLLFTHHWLGKGVLSLVVFGFIFWLRREAPARSETTAKSIYIAVLACFVSTASMLVFFVMHFLHLV